MKRIILKLYKHFKIDNLLTDFKNIFYYPEIKFIELDYEKYWSYRKKENYFQYRFPTMVDEIDNNTSVLDIGCGDGSFLFYLKQRKKVFECGIDISHSGVERALEKGINAKVTSLNDLLIDTKDRHWDNVVISEVLEHIPNAEEFLLQAFKISRFKLIITIPNSGYYRDRIRLLFGKFPVQWIYHPSEHLRFWTIRDFLWWLSTVLGSNNNYNVKILASNGLRTFNLYKYLPRIFGQQIIYIIEKNKFPLKKFKYNRNY